MSWKNPRLNQTGLAHRIDSLGGECTQEECGGELRFKVGNNTLERMEELLPFNVGMENLIDATAQEQGVVK